MILSGIPDGTVGRGFCGAERRKNHKDLSHSLRSRTAAASTILFLNIHRLTQLCRARWSSEFLEHVAGQRRPVAEKTRLASEHVFDLHADLVVFGVQWFVPDAQGEELGVAPGIVSFG